MTQDERPVSYLQESLLGSVEGTASLATVPVVVRVSGAVDVDRLERAVASVVAHHEALYSVFERRNGAVCRVVRSAETIVIQRLDAGTGEEARSVVERERARGLLVDPNEPLTRVSLVTGGPSEAFVVFVVHHLVSDAVSSGVLAGDVTRAYGGELIPAPRHAGETERLDRRRERRVRYWAERLEGSRTSLPDSGFQAPRWAPSVEPTVLTPERLHDTARQLRTVPAALVAGATAAVLGNHFNMDEDLTIGMMTTGRTAASAGTVGLLADLMPCRIATGVTVGEVMRSAVDAVIGGVSAPVTLRELVPHLEPPRDGRLFDVVLNYRDMFHGRAEPKVVDGARFSLAAIPYYDWGNEGLDPWWAANGIVNVDVDRTKAGLELTVMVAEGVGPDGGAFAAGIAGVLDSLCSEGWETREVRALRSA